jgi:hypothetical protein
LVWRNAWHQSEHLRRQAIDSYSTDPVVQILRGIRKRGSPTGTVSDEFRSAIARELKTLPLLLNESRPGFREVCVDDHTGTFGPFSTFFAELKSQSTQERKGRTSKEKEALARKISERTYLPQLLRDCGEALIFPLWPNFDPLCAKGAKLKGPGILGGVQEYWPKVTSELFAGDLAYSKQLTTLLPAAAADLKSAICILRGPVRIQNEAPRLPLFDAVAPLSLKEPAFSALIGVQHLMEETLCLAQEIVRRGLVAAENIWLLGKPYSSSERVAHRFRLFGAKAEIPDSRGWAPGHFDSCFAQAANKFLAEALTNLPRNSQKPVLLLDDGGALVRTASHNEWGAGYRAVEQTSRGIPPALGADFPVILVACSAVKNLIEPEFVARAAVSKIALYYPEALHLSKVGIIGLGNVGNYLADYVQYRRDIHHEPTVFGFDRHPDSTRESHGRFCWCKNAAEVFKQAEVVYGCSGENLGQEAEKCYSPGQLLISLSSGDIEFASLLAKANKPVGHLKPLLVKDKIIANSGFPITFDGAPLSAPLVEMQVTRALLLAGVQQAISETEHGPQMLKSEVQWAILEHWRAHALEREVPDLTAWAKEQEVNLKAWRDQREAELKNTPLDRLPDSVTKEENLSKKNEECFSKALNRASQKT